MTDSVGAQGLTPSTTWSSILATVSSDAGAASANAAMTARSFSFISGSFQIIQVYDCVLYPPPPALCQGGGPLSGDPQGMVVVRIALLLLMLGRPLMG